AASLREDLPVLHADEPSEVLLALAEPFAEEAHELAASRRGHQPPSLERGTRRLRGRRVVVGRGRADAGEDDARRRIEGLEDRSAWLGREASARGDAGERGAWGHAERGEDLRDLRIARGVARSQRAEPLAKLYPTRRGVLLQAALDEVERCERGGAGDGVPAERAAVRPWRPGHHTAAPDDRAERQSRGDALREHDDVRGDAPVLDRVELPRPAHAALDLVYDEEDPVLRRERAETREEVVGWHDVPAFALDRLDE